MDKMRWHYGDTNPVLALVAAETVIEIGDLLWLDGDTAKPAMACQTVLANLLQQLFKRAFLGVAMQHSRVGDTAAIRVATTGVFGYDCEPTTAQLGQFVRAVLGSDDTLHNQRVQPTDNAVLAIGRVARFQLQAVSWLLIDIKSTVMTGGI